MNHQDPVSFGNVTYPDDYFRFRKKIEEAMGQARQTFDETGREFGERFGRTLERVRFHRCEDAEAVLILAGSVAGTAQVAVDTLRENGVAAGLASIHVYRPFPIDVFLELAGTGSKHWVVLDRSISFGMAGPICCELGAVLSTYAKSPDCPRLYGWVGGLGGKDIIPDEFEGMVVKALQGKAEPFQWLE
jgi:2-oxoisovalerate ferredoxin oxidoreductase alpha subunit